MKFKKRADKYNEPKKSKKRYYSFLTIVLLFCAFIVGSSVFLNISKLIAYQGKIVEMKKIQTETIEKNESLKKQLEDLNARSYEAIARNNLKMSGENEVLVIVKKEDNSSEQNSGKKKKKFKKKNKTKTESDKKD